MVMRTLHIDTGREMRGGQWQVLRLVSNLEGATLLASPDSPLFERARLARVPVEPVSAAAIWRWSRRVDLVHAHDARAHTLAVLFGRPPLVVSRRVAFPVGRSVLSRLKYARVNRYIAVSRAVEQRLLEAGVPRSRIRIVPDGVPLLPLSSLDGPVIAPASDDPRKGSQLVREAAELAGVEVRFSKNLEDDLRTASLMVYITEEEGLGSAVLLAMSAGVPVVASRVGGLVEIADPRLLVDNTAGSIAQAIREARKDWGGEARARVESEFTTGSMVHATMRVYSEILAR
jgi:glycosyltransferase involved in cell wall biosynthesis